MNDEVPTRKTPPEIPDYECKDFVDFLDTKKMLEAKGYTYFGNTEYNVGDGSCWGNADAIIGMMPHPVYQMYDMPAGDPLTKLACLCESRGEHVVTTTSFHPLTGTRFSSGKCVFIHTNVPTTSFWVREHVKVTETALNPQQILVIERLRELVKEFGARFDKGSGNTSFLRGVRIPWGGGLKDKADVVSVLRKTEAITSTPPSEGVEGKAELVAEMHRLVVQLLASIEGEQPVNKPQGDS